MPYSDVIDMVESLESKIHQAECMVSVCGKSDDLPEEERAVIQAVNRDLLGSKRLIENIKRHCCEKQRETTLQ